MAGGKFDKLAGKVRPGTYMNFESTRSDTVGTSERGTVIIRPRRFLHRTDECGPGCCIRQAGLQRLRQRPQPADASHS